MCACAWKCESERTCVLVCMPVFVRACVRVSVFACVREGVSLCVFT